MESNTLNREFFVLPTGAIFNQGELESLGFIFLDNSNGTKQTLLLPKGWMLKRNGCYWYSFIDSNGIPIVTFNRLHNIFFVRSCP